jgi:glycine hydroxymethyltransferase
MNKFFTEDLAKVDPEIMACINKEKSRQSSCLELIASENFVSKAVLEAQGSILTNKYAEGYPGKRYYGGCEFVDQVENLAIERAKTLFGCNFANVQPHSGSQANQAVFMALLEPHDKILGLALDAGGHLTHGSTVNLSGRWFEGIQYSLHQDDELIDYENVLYLAQKHKPKLIIAGCSAYPQQIDFKKFRAIADAVNAHLLVDMAHFAGLVATGDYPNPFPHAHLVTTTTHKTLRGPRGGMVLTNDEAFAAKVNSALFPGIQGGPLMHVIAGKAVAYLEALQPEYNNYIKQVVQNAKILAQSLMTRGCKLVANGTASHLVVVDLRKEGLTGNITAQILEKAGITSNKNAVPFDQTKPWITSGIRLGTPACTTRGLTTHHFEKIGEWIVEIIHAISAGLTLDKAADSHLIQKIKSQVAEICAKFPLY